FGLAHWRSDNALPGDWRLESLFFFCCCYSRRSSFSEVRHSRDSIFAISLLPALQRISGGEFFMTRFDSFVIRPGAGSVLEILSRSLEFFVTRPSATREPCIRKATGFGFGLNSGGQRWRSRSLVSRCLLVEFSHCEWEPTKAIVSPRLSRRSCSQSMGLSMFQGTRWVRRLPQYFCLGSHCIGLSLLRGVSGRRSYFALLDWYYLRRACHWLSPRVVRNSCPAQSVSPVRSNYRREPTAKAIMV